MENKERETNKTNDEQKEKVTNEQIMEMLNELMVDNSLIINSQLTLFSLLYDDAENLKLEEHQVRMLEHGIEAMTKYVESINNEIILPRLKERMSAHRHVRIVECTGDELKELLGELLK